VFDRVGHENHADDVSAITKLCEDIHGQFWGGPQPVEAVEIGVWAGATTRILAKWFDRVYAVDHWCGNQHDHLKPERFGYTASDVFGIFARNMGDSFLQNVIPCRGKSSTWAKAWPRKVSFVYIDAEHTYGAVFEDISLWKKHILPGGVIAGHDLCPAFPGVERAVRNHFGEDFDVVGKSIWVHRVK
jgi:hypothetical protein